MPHIGIRELKARASEIVRQVRDRQARYVITYRGQPVGLLLPLEATEQEAGLADEAPTADPWAELEALGQEIGADIKFFNPGQYFEGAFVIGLRAHCTVQSRHGLGVVVQNFGSGVHNLL